MRKLSNLSILQTMLILSLLAGCSGLSSKKGSLNLPSKEELGEHKSLEQQIEEVYKNAAVKLEYLTEEAIKEGGEAKKFLSSDLFIKAADSSLRGDSRTSAFLYKYVTKLNPKDAYLTKKYAIELIKVGDLDTSLAILIELNNELKGKDETIGLILAGVYSSMEKQKEARKVYRQVLKHHPKNEEACVFLAKSFAVEKMYKKANYTLDGCQKKQPKKGIFAYYKGKIAINREKKKLAEKYFKTSLKIEPSYYQSAIALGLLKEEKEDYKGAAKIYKKFVKKNPENYSVLNRLVQVMFVIGDFKKVIPFAEKLSNLDPSDFNLKVRLGILYTDAQRYKDAKSVFKEILMAYPESDKVLYYLGALYQQTADFDEAVTYYSRVPSESTLFHDSHVQIAYILQARAIESKEKGKDVEVIEQFVKFVSDKSKFDNELSIELHVTLASFYETFDEVEKAINVMEKVSKKEKFGESQMYYLASLYEKTKEFGKSDGLILDILSKNPENPHALNFIGYSMLERDENLDQARDYIRKALDLKPEDGYILDSMGWYYYKIGNMQEAFKYIKKAWELTKNDSVIAKHLAIIYQEKKMYDKAKKYLVEALKLCKIESEKEDVLKAMEDLERVRLPASSKK